MDDIPSITNIYFPPKLEPLFLPQRYKIVKGGRGGTKTWGFSRALAILGHQRPIRVLCTRELQKSIKDSVHRTLSDQIHAMGLSDHYDILQNEIRGKSVICPWDGQLRNTTFSFDGIRLNAANLKSYEGVDICWVEEAQTVSDQSWRDLIPTIRKEQCYIHSDTEPSWSEIWISFNPDLETDPTYVRFVIKTPKNAFLIHTTYKDNPWYPAPLLAEIEELRERDYDEYLHVYEGQCKQNLEGAIYADQLREYAKRDWNGRAEGVVPYDRSHPVDVIFDIGKSDFTSIWFKQTVSWEHRYIDFHQSNRKDPSDHAKIIRERGYNIGTIWLPHDAKAKRYGSKLTVEEQFREFFPDQVRITPKVSVLDGIAAARTIFPNCWFDAAKCVDGYNALRHYRWEVDPVTKMFSRTPLHDQYSDAADSFRYSAVVSKIKTGRRELMLNLPGTNAPPRSVEKIIRTEQELEAPDIGQFLLHDQATRWMR